MIDLNVVLYHPGDLEKRLLAEAQRLTKNITSLRYGDNSDNKLNLGAAWNDLGNEGDAPYVAFLHSDICLTRDWDDPLLEFLQGHPEMGIVLPNPGRWDLLGREFPLSKPPTQQEIETWAIWARASMPQKHTTYATSAGDTAVFFCVIMRRSDFKALRGFDERIRFAGVNTEFEERMATMGKHTTMVHASSVWHQDARSFFRAIELGAFNENTEGENWRHWQNALKSGEAKRWHELSDQERKDVRDHPSFKIGSPVPF